MSDVLTMDQYYNYRKEIHKLYNNDTRLSGDLCSRVLELRDKNKKIESMNVSIQDYSIIVDIAEDTSGDDKLKIKDKIANRIGAFIVDNKEALDIDNEDSFDEFLGSSNHLFCDITMVGNSIKFNL